jgi:copper(I)-binding protein
VTDVTDDQDLEALEREAAELEARGLRRTGLPGARRLLLLQAPVLVVLAVVLLFWGRSTPASVAATPTAATGTAKIGMLNAYLDPPSAGTEHAYLTIRNNGDAPDRLVSVSSPWATSISLVNGSSSTPLPWITVPAHGSVTLKPGGYSILLTDLTRTPKLGDTIPLTLDYATSGPVYTFAPVGPASSLTVQMVMDAMKYMDRLPPQ